MKTQKTITLILFGLLLATTIFASNVPTKKITKITVQREKYIHSYTLEYDSKNRIKKVVPDNSEEFGITECEYGKNSFRIFRGDYFVSCSLNKQGYIINSVDGDFPILLIGDMYYNKKGQLLSIELKNANLFFKWENDDMTHMYVGNEQFDFRYTTLENKNQFGLFLKIDEEYRNLVFPYYGQLGKATKHLPASIGIGMDKITYNYKTDEDGYVTEIIMIYPDNFKIISYKFDY